MRLRTFEIRLKCVLVAAFCAAPWFVYSQNLPDMVPPTLEHRSAGISICDRVTRKSPASEALRLVCRRTPSSQTYSSATSAQVIVIGFVGGFVKPDDLRHPEVLFASYLRERYGREIHVRVFSNHDARDALSYVFRLLDINQDGVLSKRERKNANVIIYGHSWGASETGAFARELGRRRIPVLLTIQLDIIAKPGQRPTVISSNVANAINFYQPNGLLHGRQTIIAANPALTTILGNIRLEYARSAVNCDNYNWFVRTFNKPHHEIENDPRVWEQVASLIQVTVSNVG